MASIYFFLTLLVAFFLESSFLGAFRILDVVPNLVLILVILYGIYENKERVYAYGVFFGLLKDISSTVFFGLHMILFTLAAFLSRGLSKESGASTPLPVVFSIFIITFLFYYLLQGILFYLSGGGLSLGFFGSILTQFVVDSVFAFVLFISLRRYFEFLHALEKKSSQTVRR